MDKLLADMFEAEKKYNAAYEVYAKAKDNAAKAKLPKKLRPAEPKDISVGNILWYPDHGQEEEEEWDALPYWIIIDEVYRPDDQWKAYCGTDGCRHGLDGAFVEDN